MKDHEVNQGTGNMIRFLVGVACKACRQAKHWKLCFWNCFETFRKTDANQMLGMGNLPFLYMKWKRSNFKSGNPRCLFPVYIICQANLQCLKLLRKKWIILTIIIKSIQNIWNTTALLTVQFWSTCYEIWMTYSVNPCSE